MRAVVQRVKSASVSVGDEIVGEIGAGLLVLAAVAPDDDESDVSYIAEKIVNLRIFSDNNGKMNLSVSDIGGGVLAVSQFTLFGDCRKGRRPNFSGSCEPVKAKHLYERLVLAIREKGFDVQEGVFGADMDVQLVNDGPVTLLLDSEKLF